ncbi:MAG: hypothetical protein RI954_175 [Actinomycetota bacterium]
MQEQLLEPAAVLELVAAQAQLPVLARAAVAEPREQVRLLVQAVVPVLLRAQRQRQLLLLLRGRRWCRESVTP